MERPEHRGVQLREGHYGTVSPIDIRASPAGMVGLAKLSASTQPFNFSRGICSTLLFYGFVSLPSLYLK